MGEEVAKYECEQVSLADVKKYIAPKATDKELFMFMGVCKAYGLNPIKREIHFIKYGESAANIVVGYETYLKRAEKTGKLDGWEVKTDGKTATISIRRKDWKEPFVWTVERGEFDKGQANWKTMPNFMLKKVAIAQAFRLAFPTEMGGMPYIPEEINQGGSELLPAAEDPRTQEKPQEEDVPCPPVPKEEAPQESVKIQTMITNIVSVDKGKKWWKVKQGYNNLPLYIRKKELGEAAENLCKENKVVRIAYKFEVIEFEKGPQEMAFIEDLAEEK